MITMASTPARKLRKKAGPLPKQPEVNIVRVG